MIFKKILLILLIAFPVLAMAQQDSAESRNVLLKEILIQNFPGLNNSKEKRQSKNVQTSTEKVLSGVNGVTMIRRGNFAQEPTVRGLNAGQINVTIDGMTIFGACTDRMDPVSSYIEPNNLHSIVVSYGANDMAFGTSIGGGFNFKIKQPKLNAAKKWSSVVGTGYETNGNALQTLASVNYSGKRIGINVNGIFRESGNYKDGDGKTVSFSQYRKWNGGIAAKYNFKEHHYLQVNYIQDEGYDIGYPALLMDVSFAKAKIGSVSHLYHSINGSLKTVETKVFYNFIDHAMDDTKRPKEQVAMHMDMPGTSETLGFYSEAKWDFGKHQIKTRLNGYQNKLHAEMTMYPDNAAEMFMLTIPDGKRDLIGLDVSDNIKLTDEFSIIAGARADVITSSIFSEEGKKMLSGMYAGDLSRHDLLHSIFLNPVFKINKQYTVYSNIAHTSRAATLQELYGFYLFNRLDGYDYLGNPSIKNETSWNASVGGIFQNDAVRIELQAFGYFINNYITGLKKDDFSVMTIGANGVKQYGNLSSAILAGAEASASVNILPSLNFSTANTFTKGTDDDGRALPLIAPFKTVNHLNYQWKKFVVDLTGIFSAAQNHVNTALYGETKSPSYAICNMDIGYVFKFNKTAISLNIGLENILNESYFDHTDIMKIPRAGRNVITHLTLAF